MSVDMSKYCELAKKNINVRPAGVGRLAGRIAIVTGAAQGFGRGIAEELHKEGATIVIADMVDDVAVLLFDEPLANLDPATGKQAIELIDEIQKKTGATVVIIEHRLEDVLWRSVDRIVLMQDGRILADCPPDELLAQNLLAENGIREPLYLTALRYAGVGITPALRPASIRTVILSDETKKRVQGWFRDTPPAPPKPEKPVLLDARNLDFAYPNGHQALRDVSVQVKKGELMSGGGTIYTDLGGWQFTFIDYGDTDEIHFQEYIAPVIDALRALGIPAEFNGRNDLVIEGRKFSGNAQYKLGGNTVHHGSLLYATDIAQMVAATTVDEYKILSKSIKSVRDRVTNISEHMQTPLSPEAFKEHMEVHYDFTARPAYIGSWILRFCIKQIRWKRNCSMFFKFCFNI